MKNKSVIIGIVAIIILGFLIWKNTSNKEPEGNILEEQTTEVDETATEEVVSDQTPGASTTETEEAQTDSEYSYENKEFGFGVKLPGLKMTQREGLPPYISGLFLFGMGDQSEIEEQKRVPNTMGVYVWNDELEFNTTKDTGVEEKSETVNGEKFNVYSFTNEGMTSYHYTIKKGDKIYDVGVLDKKNISKFYFLK